MIRAGNSRTPANTPSPGPIPASDPSPVSIRRKPSNSFSASASVFPRMLAVIREAAAREMAQPVPWKPTSRITPSATSRSKAIRSPHRGLFPSALRLAAGRVRKFRGLRLWSRITSW